jgi:chemotaxis methyl-accepting protein methylase
MIEDVFKVTERMKSFYHHEENSNEYYEKIRKILANELDLDLTHYRDKYLHRRLYYRLLKLNIPSYRDYLQYIQNHSEEPKLFKQELTIHVTHFFRDESPFRYLEKTIFPILAKIKEDLSDKMINILCAPCSSGEEAYSLAIIANFLREKKIINNPVHIYACDLEPNIIETAEIGIYSEESMKNISEISKKQNFTKIGENMWKIQPFLKKYISFFVQDLLKPIYMADIKFDLICCRNFLIYIDKNKQRKVIENLIDVIEPHGYLMLGKTEGFPLLSINKFVPVDIREHIYKIKE